MRRLAYVGLFVLTAAGLAAQQYDTSGRLKTACEVTNAAVPVSGTVTANVGSGTQPVSGTVTCDVGAGTQAVSGTVTANAGTGTFATDPTDEDTRILGRTKIHDGTDTALVSAGGALLVDGSATTQPISAASLPLPTGAATSANQDGIIRDGTGDTTQANVTTGRLNVDGSGVTQPVSGTVTVTATNLDVQIGGTDSLTIGTFPDNEPINVAQRGGTAVVAGACERENLLYIQISQTAGTQLITGTASERIYICSIQLVTATAQNIALVDGTGSVCATSPTGLLGGSTAATGWNFAANGGIVLPPTRDSWTKTSTDADNVCLLQSGSGQISGSLTYISIPNI